MLPTLISNPSAILARETAIRDFIGTFLATAQDFDTGVAAEITAHHFAVGLAEELLAVHDTSHPLDAIPARCALQLKAWHLAALAAIIDDLTTPDAPSVPSVPSVPA